MLCKHKHAFTLGVFAGCCGSQEQFWWTESKQYQGSLQSDRACLSPLCLLVQVGVISRHNRLGSRPLMVLLQIHWIMSETDIAKTVTMNCGGGENVTLD